MTRTATIHQLAPMIPNIPDGLDMTTYAIAAIAEWQAERPYYHLSEISYRLAIPVSRHLTFALKLNGWRKVWIRSTEHSQEGLKRPVQTLWQPPYAKPIYKRSRGRPSYMQLIYESNHRNTQR